MALQTCAGCGFISPAGFNFCGGCGASLDEMAATVVSRRARVTACRPERRQLTVLFCDLVGSTELSQQLDPEDLREVIRCYQRACQPVIERYGGFLSRFLGDGILALFGYPRAHGNDAERAVHAGLELVAAVRSVSSSTRCGETLELSVRVGIATGLVVAGDLIGKDAAEEEAVVGETPNLAARLQSLAAPNSVLVGERTKRLVERQFRLTSLGGRALKGFARPVEVWRVDAPSDESMHPGTRSAVAATAIIDRVEEVRYLVERWDECVAGRSRLVVVSGEAGIGKSRVAQALRDHIAYSDHYFLRYQCSPYHANTAYFPIITHYERAARIAPADSPIEKLAKLRSLIRSPEERGNATLSALASLLSISNDDDEAFESLSAIGKRHAIYDALFEQLAELSRHRPVLALVEDIHWSDPTTLELMKRFHADQDDERILTVVTNRAGSGVSWRDFPNAGHVEMSRLGAGHSTDLVRQIASGARLPPGLTERIVAKADGVPLFVEELTRTLLDPHFEGKGGAGGGVGGTSPIPDTLQDLLTARLDQLGDGKRIAQVASVIGRQFSRALLERVVDCDETALQDGLQRLSASGLLFSEGSSPEITYTFKHALVRDTAYASLVRDERRALHLRTAEMLQSLEERVSPELLARHYTEADVPGRAIEYWLRAGQAASQRSAHREALEQFQSGLDMVRAQIAGQDRDRRLLEYLIHLGPVMIATRGSGAPETEAVYREAVSLTRSLPEAESHFIALWGWWRISKDFLVKSERAAELQRLAERLDDEGLVLQAHHCQWATRFHLGDHESCRKHIDAGVELYADRDYRSHAARFGGHDPRVCALGEAAQSAWLTGQTDKADVLMRRARSWADELKQSGSLVHVMDMNLLLTRYRCDPRAAVRQAEELIGFAREREFPEYVAKAEVFLGWALAKGRRRRQEGIEMMRAAIASHDNIGTREDPPVWLEMLADGYLESGEYRAGLDTVDEAFEHTAQSGLRFWRAELHRRRGALLVGLGEERLVEARECFRDAIAVSAEQGALSLELRATTALAKVEARLDGPSDAVAALERVLQRFTEGFGSPDYREARTVREELRVSSARP